MPRAYYNEHDKFAAAWLRELMVDGLIAHGDVDERSIVDVRPTDLDGYEQCHFFAGIGVWSLALRTAGWPDDRPIWTASCPCQPFSAAGKGGGFADERHLWPAVEWLIRQRRPAIVIGEQVSSDDGLAWLDVVLADLDQAGYACGALDTCAAGFGAPHIRQRLYWMAYADDSRLEGWRGMRERADECAAGAGSVGGGLADAAAMSRPRTRLRRSKPRPKRSSPNSTRCLRHSPRRQHDVLPSKARRRHDGPAIRPPHGHAPRGIRWGGPRQVALRVRLRRIGHLPARGADRGRGEVVRLLAPRDGAGEWTYPACGRAGRHRMRACAGMAMSKRAAEQRWMTRVAQLPCVLCGAEPVELHHIREGQGAAQRAQHVLVVALCPDCHRGSNGLHGLGTRGFYTRYRMDELDLLAKTIEALA